MKNTPQNALVHTPTDSNCQRIAQTHTILNRVFFHNLYNQSTTGFRESQAHSVKRLVSPFQRNAEL